MIKYIMSIAMLFAFVFPAYAQNPGCGIRGDVVDMLRNKYKEQIVATGITSVGTLLEVFSSFNGTTWTILVTDTHGRSCAVVTGNSYYARTFKAAESRI